MWTHTARRGRGGQRRLSGNTAAAAAPLQGHPTLDELTPPPGSNLRAGSTNAPVCSVDQLEPHDLSKPGLSGNCQGPGTGEAGRRGGGV